ITVWGVILPVGLLSIIGWFWFSGATFSAAWNPQGLSLGQGIGSSISLTLWAFLGMESAAQNSDAVENPKRDVPLPCLFGTLGAPLAGMLVLGVVQTVLALSTISPSLSKQFSKLVNLAVVTNVIPYIIALSALGVMMKMNNAPLSTYRRNMAVALIAMLYSTYALFASGFEAVMGGMLVASLTYIIWGFIAYRFVQKAGTTRQRVSAPAGQPARAC